MTPTYALLLDSGVTILPCPSKDEAQATLRSYNAKARAAKERGDLVTPRLAVAVVTLKTDAILAAKRKELAKRRTRARSPRKRRKAA